MFMIIKFNDFTMNEKLKDGDDIFKVLYALEDPEVNGYVNEFLTTHDREDKKMYRQDILLEIGNKVTEEDYNWISNELKKWINPRKNIKK